MLFKDCEKLTVICYRLAGTMVDRSVALRATRRHDFFANESRCLRSCLSSNHWIGRLDALRAPGGEWIRLVCACHRLHHATQFRQFVIRGFDQVSEGAILLLLRIICERAKINLIDSRLFEACQLIYQCFQGVAVRVCFLTEDFGPGDCSFNCHFDRFLSQLF